MIEVLFGESEAASMKAAKCIAAKYETRSYKINAPNGPTCVWAAKKRKFLPHQATSWIPGTAKEVICLGFMLDIGDITKSPASQYRKELIYSLYAQEQWGRDMLKMDDIIYADEMARLEAYGKNGEEVRIWYSDAPYSRCGFYSLCEKLQKWENRVTAVKLPEYTVQENCIVNYRNWGEVAAEQFSAFLPLEKELSKQELRMYAMCWNSLVEDNSPLRVVVNGKVIGAGEDFYDFLIWKRLTDKPVKEARLIGDILGIYQMGIGDWWYAARIEHYIRQGKIRVVEDSDNKYARMICLI